ncbi:MAG TPA: hypothetical protein VF629_03060 [Hymenobacter sp.]|jgi:hypothetical protein|uniref:hypothetical protein n=1 Tax=Hymenobacter sp. TaxID=1898978 RepID=UPI002ED89A54
MKTLADIRTLAATARRQPVPSVPEPAERLRQRFTELRDLANRRVVAAAEAGQYAVDVEVNNEGEYSYLERLYGQQGYRTAPAGGGYSSRVITLKWN